MFPQISKPKVLEILVIAASLLLGGIVFVIGFQSIPTENTGIGIDWQTIWQGIHKGQISYDYSKKVGGMFTPPWGLLFLFPLGFLSFESSWGIISYISLLILLLVVPRNRGRFATLFLFIFLVSLPTLRNFADGNLEGLVIGGISLMTLGYNRRYPFLFSMGLLLATIKVQETWLLCVTTLMLILLYWDLLSKLKALVIVGMVSIFSIYLWGEKWFKALFINESNQLSLASRMGRGWLNDITLSAALNRVGSPGWLTVSLWLLLLVCTLLIIKQRPIVQIGWQHIAFLITLSELLAPYASYSSFLTVLALGIMPIFKKHGGWGAAFLALANIPYFAPEKILYLYQSYYWTFLLLLVAIFLGREILIESNPTAENMLEPRHIN